MASSSTHEPLQHHRAKPAALVSIAAAGAFLSLLLAGPAAGQPVRGGALPEPLPLFPADNWWNADVSAAPVDPNSAGFIAFVGATRSLHPDFGGDVGLPLPDIYGMVYMTVGGEQALEPVAFDYVDESDPGAPGRPVGYPIPVEAKTQARWIEGGYPGNSSVGGDKHLLIVDRDHRLLFETWNTRCLPAGSPACSWRAGSGAVFPLDTNDRRPEGWTSADAAGLAILPGLVRYDEAFGADGIRHAIRVTVRATNGYVFPASHRASTTTNPDALPLGARLRLKPGTSPSIPSSASLAEREAIGRVVQAMKTHGLIVADNGSDMYFQGTYDTRWNNDVLNPAFASLRASDFEVIERGWRPAVTVEPGFHPVTPCRALDTRNATGPSGGPPLSPGLRREVQLAGRCGVPEGARAVIANVTVVTPPSAGELRAFPADLETTDTSVVSLCAGKTRANNAILGLDAQGNLALLEAAPSGSLHVLIDVSGFFF